MLCCALISHDARLNFARGVNIAIESSFGGCSIRGSRHRIDECFKQSIRSSMARICSLAERSGERAGFYRRLKPVMEGCGDEFIVQKNNPKINGKFNFQFCISRRMEIRRPALVWRVCLLLILHPKAGHRLKEIRRLRCHSGYPGDDSCLADLLPDRARHSRRRSPGCQRIMRV